MNIHKPPIFIPIFVFTVALCLMIFDLVAVTFTVTLNNWPYPAGFVTASYFESVKIEDSKTEELLFST